MDEQDPRVTAQRLRGRGDDDDAVGLENGAAARSAAARTSATAKRSASPARPGGADDDERKTREIRADIEHTREELSETVNAIQERLRPGQLAADAADRLKAVTRDKATEVVDSEPVRYVRANPIPTAMVGIGVAGLAWLATMGRQPRSRDYFYSGRGDWRSQSRDMEERGDYGARYSGYQSAADYNPDLSSVRRGHAAESPGSTQGWSGRDMRYRGNRAEMQSGQMMAMQAGLARTWNDNPLLIGAAAIVAGAVIGLTIPETEQENRLMGPTRDGIMDTVQDTVREKVTEVREAATNAVSQVQQVAESAIGLDDKPQG